MKQLYLSSALCALILTAGLIATASADTVNARCDIYLVGEDKASGTMACTFSQRQGYVRIQLQNGVDYDLSPVGDAPGDYTDQHGNRAYRQSGLGERGQIYRLKNESIFVYWDPHPFNK